MCFFQRHQRLSVELQYDHPGDEQAILKSPLVTIYLIYVLLYLYA